MDVRVNYDRTTLLALQAKGVPIPESIQARGLIDTGSDISALAPWIVQSLAVPVQGYAKSQNIGGSAAVRLYNVTLFVCDHNQPTLPWLDNPDLLVMELPMGLPTIDVLIGLDVLLNCRLVLDGPAKMFTLDF